MKKMKIQDYGKPHRQSVNSDFFLGIKLFHMCIGINIWTNLQGLGIITLHFEKRNLAK